MFEAFSNMTSSKWNKLEEEDENGETEDFFSESQAHKEMEECELLSKKVHKCGLSAISIVNQQLIGDSSYEEEEDGEEEDADQEEISENDKEQESGDETTNIKQLDFLPKHHGANAIYIPSKNVILIISSVGYSGFDQCYDKYLYTINNSKWTKIETTGDNDNHTSDPNIILSSDEKYILLIGGVFDAGSSGGDTAQWPDRSIWVYCIDNIDPSDPSTSFINIKKSCIVCPEINYSNSEMGFIHSTIKRSGGVEDDILVDGYIKKCFESSRFSDLAIPPRYISKIIINYYNCEEIHFYAYNEAKEKQDHYIIRLRDILKSLI